jgi:hypothetical protein
MRFIIIQNHKTIKSKTKDIITSQSITRTNRSFELQLPFALFFLALSFPAVSQYSINGRIEDVNNSGVPFANVL